MKLSKRLTTIYSMVTDSYDHIWDCCCDHGLLGSALLQQHTHSQIHFVDIVPDLINTVENNLANMLNDNTLSPEKKNNVLRAKTHCIDVAELPLSSYQGNQLVIIAGVGGDLMNHFMTQLRYQYAHLPIDFLLCPVHHLYSLRNTLIDLDYHMKEERLVEDNHRFYEILLISQQQKQYSKITPVGHDIWLAKTIEEKIVAQAYLKQLISHYQRMNKNTNRCVSNIIDAYQAITL